MTIKQRSLGRLAIILLAIIAVNIAVSFAYFQIDLTQDKRFTISDATQKLLNEADDIIYFDIFLSGDLPSDYKRMQIAIQEMMDSWTSISKGNVQFQFNDVFTDITDPKQLQDVLKEFKTKGMDIRDVGSVSNDEVSKKRIVPSILLTFKGREVAINILPPDNGDVPGMIDKGIALLEYNCSAALSQMLNPREPKVAFLQGHGELLPIQVYDVARSLGSRGIAVEFFDSKDKAYIPAQYNAIIIAKPSVPFTENEKFKIDQYIMSGGNVIWAIDQVVSELDSLMNSGPSGIAVTFDRNLNLDDMLFTYGARINRDFVQDTKCNGIPLMRDNSTKPVYYPWFYYPIIYPIAKHPIAQHLDPLRTEFPASVDTIEAPGIRKTVILSSSDASRLVFHPQELRLSMSELEVNTSNFPKSNIPMAVLLEGKFRSVYKNRPSPEFLKAYEDSIGLKFRNERVDSIGKQVVIGDGDIFRNEIRNDQPAPVAIYKYNPRIRFANRDFFLNAIDYVLDNSGLISTRNKEFKVRALNFEQLEKEKSTWQWQLLVFPLIILWVPAFVFVVIRIKKYGRI